MTPIAGCTHPHPIPRLADRDHGEGRADADGTRARRRGGLPADRRHALDTRPTSASKGGTRGKETPMQRDDGSLFDPLAH